MDLRPFSHHGQSRRDDLVHGQEDDWQLFDEILGVKIFLKQDRADA